MPSRNRPGSGFLNARARRIQEQQQTLEALRSGQGITAQPASPILGAVRTLLGRPNMGQVYGAELDNKSVLRMPGGMKETGLLGPINVAGRTWYPAQRGEDVIFMQGKEVPGPGAALAAGEDDGRVSGLFTAPSTDETAPPSLPPSLPPTAPVKQYEMTPQGQFDRYFGSSEMDQYFGAGSRGKGAPADAVAMDKLASGKGVPEGTGIAAKYRAESAMGRGNMDEIVEAMGYKGSPMETWARANPMLAFREYNKKFPAGEPTIGPTPAALQASEGPMTAFGQEVKTFFPGAEPGADADMGRLEGEELIDAYNYMRGQKGGSREPVSNRVGAFLGKYGDLGALTK